MDVKDLVKEFQKNNLTNFQEFYKLTERQVFFTAYAILRDQALAEDIMQDTYLTFLKYVNNLDSKQNILAYLSTIARNLSLNEYKKRKREVVDSEHFANLEGENKDFYSDSKVTAILSLLDNDEEREIVVFHVLLDYKFKDIAKIMEKPLGTILWQYNKAIKKLKERVKVDEF